MRVVNGSDVYKNLEECRELNKSWREMMLEFKEKAGLVSEEFYVAKDLGIASIAEEDREKVKGQLKVDGVWFKKNSALGKLYSKMFKERGLEDKQFRMFIWDYHINLSGRHKVEKFKLEEEWYVHIEANCDFTVDKDNYIEIKASEYYAKKEMLENV